jgi:hypothetical protein
MSTKLVIFVTLLLFPLYLTYGRLDSEDPCPAWGCGDRPRGSKALPAPSAPWTPPDHGGEDDGGGAAPVPACYPTAPSVPYLVSPDNGAIFVKTTSVLLRWGLASWGNNCAGGGGTFYVYSNNGTGNRRIATTGSTSYTYATPTCNTTYKWYVTASNGARARSSSTRTFYNTGSFSPEAYLDSYPTDLDMAGTSGIYQTGTYTASATDVDSDLAFLRLYRKRSGGSSTIIGTPQACSGAFCSTSRTWVPICSDAGDWEVYADAQDACGVHTLSVPPGTTTVEKAYNFRVHSQLVPLGRSKALCTDPVLGNYSGLKVYLYDNETDEQLGEGTTDSSGYVTFSNISMRHTKLRIVTPASGDDRVYCEDREDTMENVFYYDVGSDIATCSTETLTLGLNERPATAWETIVDGDAYGNSASVTLDADGGSGDDDFKPYLVNTNGGLGGFIRSANDMNPDDIVDKGGYSEDLEYDPGWGTSNDVWLTRFNFDRANSFGEDSGITEISSFPALSSGGIYRMDIDTFNGLASLDYSFGKGVAVLYVTGAEDSDELLISKPLKASGDGRLVIVSKAAIVVTEEVGEGDTFTDITLTYKMNSESHIDAGLISEGGIEFEGDPETIPHRPVMLGGFIATRGRIIFARDAFLSNNYYPGEAIRFDHTILYELTKLEKDHPEKFYTGLATFDVKWDYGDY